MKRAFLYSPPVPMCLSWEDAHDYAWQIVLEHAPLLTARTRAVWGNRRDYQQIRQSLIDAGNDGLFSAAWRYKPHLGEWSTYASHAIFSRQYHAVQSKCLVRPPRRAPEMTMHSIDGMQVAIDESSIDEALDRADRRAKLIPMVESLPLRLRDVVISRYLVETPEPYSRIGKRYGVSKQRAHQLELEAICRLRSAIA